MTEPVVLKVYRNDRLISVKQFLTPQIVIGRKPESSLALDDETVAPIHAMIERRGVDYFLTDLGSETGVQVEGENIIETMLNSGEALIIGPYSIRFYIGVPTPSVAQNYKKTHATPSPKRTNTSTADESVVVKSRVKTTPKKEEQSTRQINHTDADDEATDPGIDISVPEANISQPATSKPAESSPKASKPVTSNTPNRVPPPVPFDSFSGEDKEETHTGMSDDDKTDPGVTVDSAVKIDRLNVDNQIKNLKDEPQSSGKFSSASLHQSVEEILDPASRGSVVQVLICWKERILKTYHYSNSNTKNRVINISNSDESSIFVPLMGPKFKQRFLSLNDRCMVHLSSSMTGSLIRKGQESKIAQLNEDSQISVSKVGKVVDLDQGQMLRVNLLSDRVVVYVSHVADAPKAQSAPVLGFSSSEMVGIFMSFASILLVALYMLFYAPSDLNDTDKLLEDRLKKAVITFNPPPVKKIPPKPKPKPKPKVVKKTKVAEKKAKPKKVKVGEKKRGVKNPSIKKTKVADKPKKAAPSRKKTNNKIGSSRPGGSVKTGKKAANMKSQKKDVTKTGLLSVLAGGGVNTALDKASSGVGQTLGTADSKTGFQGQLSDQAGEGLGTKLQQAGKGGQGSALAGAGDIQTSGRGGGSGEYGVAGLGGKGDSTIVNVDGDAGEFSSSIDKEAIRRLIRRNRNAIAACYEKGLVRNSSLSGKVVLSWNIRSGGKMTDAKVISSTLTDKSVEKCLIVRLRGLTFPSPGENEIAEVSSYPFVFESGR